MQPTQRQLSTHSLSQDRDRMEQGCDLLKLALIGQQIASLLPSMLTDLLQVGHQAADITIEEKNSAMQELLQGYGEACLRKAGIGGTIQAAARREDVLRGADLVIYAGDLMASSRFQQDREALSGGEGDNEGLLDQARVNGGIGGLLHTLRQGAAILPLTELMHSLCPNALVICLGDPVGRTTEMFHASGFRAYGLARSVLRGPTGVDGIAEKLGKKLEDVAWESAGLPGFTFLTAFSDHASGISLMNEIYALAGDGNLGRLIQRWYRDYQAVGVGRVTDIAEYMAAQEDFIPDEHPDFGESVEHRKDRILHMNKVREKGLADPEGMISQLMLLSKTPPLRPVRLGLALLRHEDLNLPEVTRINNGNILSLSSTAFVSCPLVLEKGQEVACGISLPAPLSDLMGDIAYASHLAARAAFSDRSALREYVEMDPALEGLDRLYVQDVVDAMVRMHSDILVQFEEDTEDLF